MSTLTKNQKIEKSHTNMDGKFMVKVQLRFDDDCENGHNTFAITADTFGMLRTGRWAHESGGCLHEDIAKYFPQYAHLIKWHLVSTDGPLHYIANTLYHANDRDHWGLRKGEFRQQKDKNGYPLWRLPRLSSDIVSGPGGKPDWIMVEYEPVGIMGEGKERQLDSARSAACWPEATDEELSSDNLKEMLEARLPNLLKEFREDMENLGFTW